MKRLISSFLLIACLAAHADVTQTFGTGSAATSIDRVASFDTITASGIDLSAYTEDQIDIWVPNISYIGFDPFGNGTTSQFYYGYYGNTFHITIKAADAATMYALELLAGGGWPGSLMYFGWQAFADGLPAGSGKTPPTPVGTVLGFYDPSGFDELRVAAWLYEWEDFGNPQFMALDDVRLQVLPPPPIFADSFEACEEFVEGYPDADMDGFGDDSSQALEFCRSIHYGYVDNALDCDDSTGDVFPGQVELCDDVDNDCDQEYDEDFLPGGTVTFTGLFDGDTGKSLGQSCGTGACQDGTIVCGLDGTTLDCDTETQATEELCDAFDNDCDGIVDEGNPGGGGVCDTGQLGICAAGTNICEDGTLQCLANEPPVAEVCDGLDNDCDGSTDEGNPGGGGVCDTGQQGVCAVGTTSCIAGDLQCVANVTPVPEICYDGLDNDCDGSVDEGCP